MDPSLRNIATGVTAHANVHNAKTVGDKISVTDYTFKRSLQAITMDAKTSVKIRDEILSCSLSALLPLV
jgi:hypothetical protein